MSAEGTENRPFEEPIGHGIAFRYRTTDGLLAIEYNPFLLSPSRVFDYIYEFEPQAEFDVTPRMREDLWERSEEHTSELQSLMRISYAVFCLKKKTETIRT